jgi:site-specific DNA recombinase
MKSAVVQDELAETVGRAILYARVSTKEQAERNDDPEGYSIPAQREACQRKAEALGGTVIAEFVDRGESARSADRTELQKMLKFLKSESVDFVIVHKIDRLARNRSDDVAITAAIAASGAKLVSVTENIDETPSGHLLHGIMSSIAEFYSRNLAAEVMKGTQQKVRSGGTPMRAPVGYLNVREFVAGREGRTVELDPERAPLVRWAFGAYATGDWSLRSLATELEAQGLAFRPTAKQAARPVPANKLQEILRNRYYIGYVSYNGVEYEGKHPKLVADETFAAVQSTLDGHRTSGERSYRRDNYLAGSLRCNRCKSRLLYGVTRGKHGDEYGYFFCAGRHSRKTGCTLRYLPEHYVEKAVATYWLSQAPAEDTALLREQLLLDFAEFAKTTATERDQWEQRIATIKRERLKWAEKAMDGAVPNDIARDKQAQLAGRLLQAEAQLGKLRRLGEGHRTGIEAALLMIEHCGQAYQTASASMRRTYNQVWFDYLDIDEDPESVVVATVKQPELIEGALRARCTLRSSPQNDERGSPGSYRVTTYVGSSNVEYLVEVRGLEPLASSVRVRRSTRLSYTPQKACRTYHAAACWRP